MRNVYEDSGWSGEATFDKNGRQTSSLDHDSEYYPIEYEWDWYSPIIGTVKPLCLILAFQIS